MISIERNDIGHDTCIACGNVESLYDVSVGTEEGSNRFVLTLCRGCLTGLRNLSTTVLEAED